MTSEIPEILLKNPPRRLYAYIHSHPNGQLMGVTMDGQTGKPIDTCILPTKQRVMLGLGIGNDNAHAHAKYRQLYPQGYKLIWSDDPETDRATQGLKERLLAQANDAERSNKPTSERRHIPSHQDVSGALSAAGQLTAKLVRAGAESAARKVSSPAPTGPSSDGSSEAPPSVGEQDQGSDDAAAPSHGGFF